MTEAFAFRMRGEPVHALADRALWWPARRRLVIADLHLGKGDAFRHAGIAVPRTESLKDTVARAVPYYEAEIAPALSAGKRVLVSAHGNSLRGIIKYLSDISDDEIVGLEIPTGKPIVYELAGDLSVERRYDLGKG